MKAVFISFNQAYYEMIIDLMDHNNIRGFTYWPEVHGRGSVNGEPRYGSHAWPALNSAIITVIADEKVDSLLELLRTMDKQTEALGLRAFVWNVEKSI